jgi:hypothetical protein
MKDDNPEQKPTTAERGRHCVRLPGFLVEEGIGLGHALKRMTYTLGIKPCVGCEKRAAALDRWMTFYRE